MSKTVLIIDDDQTLVAPLKDGLESIGYRVAVAFDGLQGILQAHQARPDVIILDFHMPGGGGQTVYERLRASAETAATPIVFSTVITLDELKNHIKPTGNTYFLRKPVGLSQIIGVLNGVLGEKKEAINTPAPPQQPFHAVPPPAAAPKPAAAPLPEPSSVPTRPAPAAAPTPAPAPAPAAAPAVKKSAKTPPSKWHEHTVRVSYADTDKMGIIYYANYFKYFESARTELLRSVGLRWRDLEISRKLYLPAVEANCKYLGPSRYDSLLVVRTWISHLGRGSVVFENDILDKDQNGKQVARGFSRHAVVNDLWRSTRVPDDIRTLLLPFVGQVD